MRGELKPESVSDYNQLMSDQSIPETIATAEKFRLSTRWTLVFKLAGLVFWLTILMLLGFGPRLIEETPGLMIPELSTTGWLVLLTVGFGTSFTGLYVIGTLREVFVLDAEFY